FAGIAAARREEGEGGGGGEGDGGPPHHAPARSSNPTQRTTGSLGYFGNLGSTFDRSQSENDEPRVLRMSF
ncbi:MAG: hypothetical protein M3320_03015, partial [Actinomycetota bacterium]|nr:hypothetical protein [Actinomycetota bacterium]